MRTDLKRMQKNWPPVYRYLLGVLMICFLMAALAAVFPFAWRTWVNARYDTRMYTLTNAVEMLPREQVAIVYGARVYPSGRLSAMLRDRVDTAIALYEAGKVDKLIVSGDNQFVDYDEPGAMMAYAIEQGVPADDVQPDYGGRRTYDTCYRAKTIFGVESALLVTQAFHLPRALFLCNSLGLESYGVIADRRPYDPRSVAWSESRELPALLIALVDVIRKAPPPVLGDPIPIH
jgi:SanA protein